MSSNQSVPLAEADTQRLWRIVLWGAAGVLLAGSIFWQAGQVDWAAEAGAGLQLKAAMVIFAAALLCEYFDSSLGMGYGTTLTPLLLIAGFEPLQIVPAVLCSEFLSGLSAGVLHHRHGNVDLLGDPHARRTLGLLSLLSVVGALTAVTVAVTIPKFWVGVLITFIILSMGGLILATRHRRFAYRARNVVVVGAVAAFNKGVSGGGYGPLVTAGQVVSGVPAKHAVAITSVAESLTCLVGLSAYLLFKGQPDWSLVVPLCLGALLSVPLATRTVRWLPEKVLRSGVGIFTTLLGLLALAKLLQW